MTEKFVTKDTGQRQEFNSGMKRDTQQGKARFDLLLVDYLPYDEQLLTRWAQLMARGAEKYGEKNWQLANSLEELNRFKASGLRHHMQYLMGDTEEDHAAATCYNLNSGVALEWKIKNLGEKNG